MSNLYPHSLAFIKCLLGHGASTISVLGCRIEWEDGWTQSVAGMRGAHEKCFAQLGRNITMVYFLGAMFFHATIDVGICYTWESRVQTLRWVLCLSLSSPTFFFVCHIGVTAQDGLHGGFIPSCNYVYYYVSGFHGDYAKGGFHGGFTPSSH